MADPSIVLITGGNTGIGYETVKALYASPSAHTILMGSRSLDKASEAIKTLKQEITSAKSTIEAIQLDIEDDESIQKTFKYVENKYGRIDALVNNAGPSPFTPPPNPPHHYTNARDQRRRLRRPSPQRC
jgi:NAD(P)-dependent dehydrogenase (short-subunit alcohol dehydrogenase family)